MTETTKTAVIIVGVDGSENSDAAVRWAERYADVTGGSLRLVTAFDWPHALGIPYATLEGYNPGAEAKKVAEKAASQVSLPPDRVEVCPTEGSPRQVLVDAAEGADLLVVGSRGHSSVGLLIGSVSAYCTQHAPVPVVVVR